MNWRAPQSSTISGLVSEKFANSFTMFNWRNIMAGNEHKLQASWHSILQQSTNSPLSSSWLMSTDKLQLPVSPLTAGIGDTLQRTLALYSSAAGNKTFAATAAENFRHHHDHSNRHSSKMMQARHVTCPSPCSLSLQDTCTKASDVSMAEDAATTCHVSTDEDEEEGDDDVAEQQKTSNNAGHVTDFSIAAILKPHFGSSENKMAAVKSSSSPSPPTRGNENISILTSSASSSNTANSPVKANASAAQGQGQEQGQMMWPAWVYCTRYSDRPSSGRSRLLYSCECKKLIDKLAYVIEFV